MLRPRQLSANELVYDWNEVRPAPPIQQDFELLDETLRDGLQNPSVRQPALEEKLGLLRLMDALGIEVAKLGLPASSERAFADCLALCQSAVRERLGLQVACAARTVARDVAAVAEISQRAGVAVAVYAFVGSSPIRASAEGWDPDFVRQRCAEAVGLGVREGLPVTLVTEDATRARPEVLAELFRVALDHGASRLCLCDTVGHAAPGGARAIVEFARSVVAAAGVEVGIDWHGHNDRGLALSSALAALEAGADRIHATALGIGERAGNTPMELLLVNLDWLGLLPHRDLSGIPDYCRSAASALGWEIPKNYPLVGRDAFRTATGVHAAAIAKARSRGAEWLADRVYSGVPAIPFGRRQEICIGANSGAWNVLYWLESRNIDPRDDLVRAILAAAKRSERVLSEDEVMAIVNRS